MNKVERPITLEPVKIHLLRRSRKAPLELGDDLEDLAEALDYSLAAFYRREGDVLRSDTKTESRYLNHCNEAVRVFGSVLREQELFADFPDARYLELRSDGPFNKHYGDFHSVGLVITDGLYLAIDLTHNDHNHINPMRTAIFQASEERALFGLLSHYYGGIWRPEAIYHPVSGKFPWADGKDIATLCDSVLP
ncbi:hypothetical protein COV20_05545 [Candidatus Woesearchaeota archaeon CG10_big_fil_rev_8_21_14_0_10_45_16]|nr:MAG: hypothetical protein COV20_05545 [Candidatus Woesearchaeota archaeon CG10_big_fil_rev_8_21_14_0_10_45_16]